MRAIQGPFGLRVLWLRQPSREASLTSHRDTTRPLCTLYGPTIWSITDSKMVTECAKCARASGVRPQAAAFARFVALDVSRNADKPSGIVL